MLFPDCSNEIWRKRSPYDTVSMRNFLSFSLEWYEKSSMFPMLRFFKNTLRKKWSIPLTISSVNVTKSTGICGNQYWSKEIWRKQSPYDAVSMGNFISLFIGMVWEIQHVSNVSNFLRMHGTKIEVFHLGFLQ